MDFSRLTSQIAADAAKLAEAADGSLDAPVPTCPGWMMSDLVHHVAATYDHKTQCMRLGHNPPPRTVEPAVPPLTRMRAALGDLLAEFTGRQPSDETYTWYDADQTVGFWMRRMAHETVVHRVDAELAAGVPISPIDDDLALDGVDEMLTIFVDWSSKHWAEELKDALAAAKRDTLVVRSEDRMWTVRVGDTVDVTEGDTAEGGEAATISGSPTQVLLWLWRRTDDVTVTGDAEAAASFRELIGAFGG